MEKTYYRMEMILASRIFRPIVLFSELQFSARPMACGKNLTNQNFFKK